ncbi:MAG: sulfotransferase family protein [Alphaproteobacteria bacterium]|nr:MAG: sulfotransferase family protein [Alphaproteobacteria bacterium]
MGLKVIGAGYGRTATLSLKAALERLGFGPCYHMVEVLAHEGFAAHWARAARGERMDWDAVFDGYAATVDWPAADYWRELADHYPEARVILSVRDPESWFASTQATIFSSENLARLTASDVPADVRAMVRHLSEVTLGGRPHDREHVIATYERHNEAVRRTIPPERLLVYDVGAGWEPLCAFLGVPVPDLPYPRSNSSAEFRDRISRGELPRTAE